MSTLILIADYIKKSPNSYFMDMANQLKLNIKNSKIININNCIDSELNDSDYKSVICIRGAGYEKRDILIGKKIITIFDDIHFFNDNSLKARINLFEFSDIILLPYYNKFLNISQYEKYYQKSYWLPFHMPKYCEDIKMDWEYKLDKVLLTGRATDPYPFRKKIILKGDKRIDILKHPGYKGNFSHDIIGHKYYDYINKYKGNIITTASNSYQGFDLSYTLLKYFEICNTIPFIEETDDIKELGFIDNENCIIINEENYLDKINININNRQIAINAMKFMKKNHTFLNRFDIIRKHI